MRPSQWKVPSTGGWRRAQCGRDRGSWCCSWSQGRGVESDCSRTSAPGRHGAEGTFTGASPLAIRRHGSVAAHARPCRGNAGPARRARHLPHHALQNALMSFCATSRPQMSVGLLRRARAPLGMSRVEPRGNRASHGQHLLHLGASAASAAGGADVATAAAMALSCAMGKEGPGVQRCRVTSTTTPASEMAAPMTFLKFFNILCAPSVRLDGAPMEATAGLAIPMAGIEKLQARVKSPTSPAESLRRCRQATDARERTGWPAVTRAPPPRWSSRTLSSATPA